MKRNDFPPAQDGLIKAAAFQHLCRCILGCSRPGKPSHVSLSFVLLPFFLSFFLHFYLFFFFFEAAGMTTAGIHMLQVFRKADSERPP